MGRQVIVSAIVLTLSACHVLPESKCQGGAFQCVDNVLQGCYADEFLGGAYWHTVQSCPPSQACRVDTAGPTVDLGASERGCFAPNAYCPNEGFTQCMSQAWTDSSLWSCTLRASDQTLRWSTTSCSGQVPRAICAITPDGAPEPTSACFQVVENCPAFPALDSHCEGNVVYGCTGPTVIGDKALFDWVTTDCALNGQVCRVNPTYGPGCVNP
jgi:hypothetical protein